MFIYIAIFISKIIENALATLRIIVISNGRKKLGAILQGLVTLLWLIVTGFVIIDIDRDVFRVIFFCLGCVVGSYLGSFLEERIALGTNTTIAIINNKYKDLIFTNLKNYRINILNTNNSNFIIMLIIPRKRTYYINKIINDIDSSAIITNLRSKILFNNS